MQGYPIGQKCKFEYNAHSVSLIVIGPETAQLVSSCVDHMHCALLCIVMHCCPEAGYPLVVITKQFEKAYSQTVVCPQPGNAPRYFLNKTCRQRIADNQQHTASTSCHNHTGTSIATKPSRKGVGRGLTGALKQAVSAALPCNMLYSLVISKSVFDECIGSNNQLPSLQ